VWRHQFTEHSLHEYYTPLIYHNSQMTNSIGTKNAIFLNAKD